MAPRQWKVLLLAIEDDDLHLSGYEIEEFGKCDFIWDIFGTSANWPLADANPKCKSMHYIANQEAQHENETGKDWETQIKPRLQALKDFGGTHTLVYITDHVPAGGTDVIIHTDPPITPQILNDYLPKAKDEVGDPQIEEHIVIICGGASGRFINQLKSYALHANTLISSTNLIGECPLSDHFDIGPKMLNADLIQDAFLEEKARLLLENPVNQHPFMECKP